MFKKGDTLRSKYSGIIYECLEDVEEDRSPALLIFVKCLDVKTNPRNIGIVVGSIISVRKDSLELISASFVNSGNLVEQRRALKSFLGQI